MKMIPGGGLGRFPGGFSLGGSFGAFLSVGLGDEQLRVMDFKPAQGGGIAREGSGSELGRGDGDFSLCQGVKSGLDTGVGNAGDARAGPEQSNLRRIALGGVRGGGEVFLVAKELAFGVDERAAG
jgi:hypothetical protein